MDFTNLKNFMDFMAEERTPSNAISVFLGGKEVYRYAAGYADLKTEKKLTGNEHFNIYSCSKIATVTAGATAIMDPKINLVQFSSFKLFLIFFQKNLDK